MSSDQSDEESVDGGDHQTQGDQDGDDTIFELIRRVETRPFIYNCRDPKHSKRDEINFAWKEIAKGLKMNGKVVNDVWCKKQWKAKRDYYYKIKKGLKGKSGDGAKSKKPWVYYTAMDRVLSAFNEENENTQSNFPGDDSNETPNASSDSQIQAENSNSGINENENSSSTSKESTPVTSSTKRVPKRKLSDSEKLLNEKIMKVLEEPEEVKDQFYHFGMTICNKLRSVPIQTAEYAMARISSILYEIMYPNEGWRDNLASNAAPRESTPAFTNHSNANYVLTELK